VSEPQTSQTEAPAEPEPVAATPAPGDDDVIADELLVEEVSIDGMCGVY